MEMPADQSFVLLSFALMGCALLGLLHPLGISGQMAALRPQARAGCLLYPHLALLSMAIALGWLGGYHLAHSGVDGGYGGEFKRFFPDDQAQINYSGTFIGNGLQGAASASWLLFVVASLCPMGLVFLAAGSSLGERSGLIAAAVTGAILFPIMYAWSMGDGWLQRAGFVDGAGAASLHLVAGGAALGIAKIASRKGLASVAPDERVHPVLQHGGLWLRWLGLFALTLGLGLHQARPIDAVWMGLSAGNLMVASGAGLAFTLLLGRWKKDLNVPSGLLLGLIALTADPLSPTMAQAALIGIGGAICGVACRWWLVRRRMADPYQVVAIHLGGGLWASAAVCLINPMAGPKMQIIGAGSSVAFAFFVMWAVASACGRIFPAGASAK